MALAKKPASSKITESANLMGYARFIDDGIGLWDTAAGLNPARAWERFSTAVYTWGSLTWIISPLTTTQVNYLDVTFTLQDGYINYSLYAKDCCHQLIRPTQAQKKARKRVFLHLPRAKESFNTSRSTHVTLALTKSRSYFNPKS
jgi:hypothetical protein